MNKCNLFSSFLIMLVFPIRLFADEKPALIDTPVFSKSSTIILTPVKTADMLKVISGPMAIRSEVTGNLAGREIKLQIVPTIPDNFQKTELSKNMNTQFQLTILPNGLIKKNSIQLLQTSGDAKWDRAFYDAVYQWVFLNLPSEGPQDEQTGIISFKLGSGEQEQANQKESQPAQHPQFKIRVTPEYPKSAKKANVFGFVHLNVKISPSGEVEDVEVLSSLGYGCDEAAVAAVKKSTFIPATRNGKPVVDFLRVSYRFKFAESVR